MGRKAEGEHRTVVSNRKARHDYEILERFETGIVLTGSEVKSLRAGRGSLAEAYGRVRDGEVWIEGMHVPPYEQAMDKRTHDPIRPRRISSASPISRSTSSAAGTTRCTSPAPWPA